MIEQIFALILLIAKSAVCYQCDIHADSLVRRDVKLDGYQIWSAPTSDLGSCARACVRVKLCLSFNFDLSTRLCDLNSEVIAESQIHRLKKAPGKLYSSISEWPPTVIVFLLFHFLLS